MSINTNDLVIEKGIWTTIPILGTRTIIEKIEGSEVRYRFGAIVCCKARELQEKMLTKEMEIVEDIIHLLPEFNFIEE